MCVSACQALFISWEIASYEIKNAPRRCRLFFKRGNQIKMAEKTRNETAADEELKTLRERLKACEFLLIGLGSEWEKAGGAEVQEAYRALASMTEGKDYFIVTTAKDARIFESSLDEAKITAPCGNVNWLQCSKGCTKDIWERGEVADGICPHCGAPLTENTVLANPYIEEGYLKSWNLYRINQKFYQIVGDIQERTVSIPQNSVGFIRNFASCD